MPVTLACSRKVVGTVVATRKDERLVSNKLLVARPVDPSGKPEGNYLVAVDTVDAGFGETVLIVSGSSARMAAGMKDCPGGRGDCRHRRSRRRRERTEPMQIARVIGDVVATRQGRESRRAQAARPAAGHARREPPAARSSR